MGSFLGFLRGFYYLRILLENIPSEMKNEVQVSHRHFTCLVG